MAAFDLGYKEERFEKDVDDNFHCAICLNVLKDPVSCQRNQHYFCTTCITRHLQNSNTCPSCRDELTVETLGPAPRVLTNLLSALKIRCDFVERGCVGFHQLGDLKRHVEDCGFASVFCSNDGCRVEICKRDRTHHEAEECEFRKLKCHDCAALRKEVEEVKEKLKDIEGMREDLASVKDKMTKLPDLLRGIIKEEMIKDNRATEMKDEIKQSRRHHGQDQLHSSCLISVKEDIIIAGGRCPDGGLFWTYTNSVEMFIWSTMSWVSLNPLKQGRAKACSFVYENSLFVAGGTYNPVFRECTDTIERTNIAHLPEQWINFPAKLPTTNKDFKSVVYKDRLIITGGYIHLQGCLSMSINELLLVPPYSGRLLTTMPQPRVLHGAELIKDKIFIVGGSTSYSYKDTLDSVLVYDINTNECKEMAPLPFPVSRMATVSKGDNIVLIGGKDKNNQVLNAVVMYDTNTGKSELLPEMKSCRVGCSAVITGNVIVVMGGFDEGGNELSSVESFEFSSYEWKDLPPMKLARVFATAVAKPGNFT